jgi:hypothetical protein
MHETVNSARKKANPFSAFYNNPLCYETMISPPRYCFCGNVKSFGKILD